MIPPCPVDDGDTNSHSDRLLAICREHASSYRDMLDKYQETIFSMADELLRKSQDRQMQQLKVCYFVNIVAIDAITRCYLLFQKLLEKETGDVMRQLQLSRKNEVKQLALVHKDKDELERYTLFREV